MPTPPCPNSRFSPLPKQFLRRPWPQRGHPRGGGHGPRLSPSLPGLFLPLAGLRSVPSTQQPHKTERLPRGPRRVTPEKTWQERGRAGSATAVGVRERAGWGPPGVGRPVSSLVPVPPDHYPGLMTACLLCVPPVIRHLGRCGPAGRGRWVRTRHLGDTVWPPGGGTSAVGPRTCPLSARTARAWAEADARVPVRPGPVSPRGPEGRGPGVPEAAALAGLTGTPSARSRVGDRSPACSAGGRARGAGGRALTPCG